MDQYFPFAEVEPIKDWRYYVFWTASVLTLPVLLPCKVILMVVSVSLSALFAWPFSNETPNKFTHPALFWLLTHIEAFTTRLFTFSFGYFRYRVVNKHLAPKRGDMIVVSNHVSSVDPAFLISLGIPTFMAKSDVSAMPGFGVTANALRCIFIKRGNGASKVAAEELRDRMKVEGAPLTCIFVEGTTTNEKALIPFKLGAFEHGVPVRMLVLKYGNRYIDPSDAGVSMAKAALRQMLCIYNSFTVEYLGVYEPSFYEVQNPSVFAENVRDVFTKYLKIPKSPFTVFDKFYYRGVKGEYFTWEKTSEEFKELFHKGQIENCKVTTD